ncbi:MAG TPA: hypothetical protein VF407_18675 [Polyangiaceae bacterium]
MFGRLASIGLAAGLMAMVTLAPEKAIAADPLQPTADGWTLLANDSHFVSGVENLPGLSYLPYNELTDVKFQSVKVGNGPLTAVTQVTLQRPRGQYEQTFNLAMGKSLFKAEVVVRKPAVNGQADWFQVTLSDPKIVADELRKKEGATSGTEILILSFSKATVKHRVQTASGYGTYTEVPAQFDIVGNVVLPVPPPAPPGGPRPTPPSGMRQ